jgi:hypothetical protein
MGTTFGGRNGGDAHGIGVLGTTADHPIEEVEIVGNELANLTLGSSEALVVNGNVKDFSSRATGSTTRTTSGST